jgi:hypothetical protein
MHSDLAGFPINVFKCKRNNFPSTQTKPSKQQEYCVISPPSRSLTITTRDDLFDLIDR